MERELSTLRTVFLAVAAIVVVCAAVIFSTAQVVIRQDREAIARLAVTDELQRLLSTVQDAEAGQRGFLLTGKPNYLDPYESALQRVHAQRARVRALAQGDAPLLDADRVEQLDERVSRKLRELDQTIRLRGDDGPDAAMAVVNSDEGKRLMAEIRCGVGGLADDQRQRVGALRRSAQRWIWARGAAYALAAAAVLPFLWWAYRRLRGELAGRIAAGELIERQKEGFRVTLASIGDAVIVTDPSTRITFANDAAARLTGWPAEEALGRPLPEVFRIIAEDDRRQVENPVQKVLRDGVTVGLANHTVLLCRDGSERPIYDSGAPVRAADGRVLGVVLVFRDMTEERDAARALARLAEEREQLLDRERAARAAAERANRTKDQFLAALSHELRTPLTPALFTLSMLRDEPSLPQGVRNDVDSVRGHVELEARLIDDLLDLTRVATGRLKLLPKPTDLHAVLNNAIQIAGADGGLKQEVDLSAGEHHVLADSARLQQVFWNLLSNARKFTPIGGRVAIRSSNPVVGRVRVEVADSGRGIEPDALAKVFEAFEQGEPSLARQYGGLGLGLAIARSIVLGHGGTITAHSDGKGRGATFAVELATIPAPRTEPPAAATGGEPAAPRRLRVLVVEDHDATARILARLLQHLGHEVVTAGTVRSAIAAADAGRFDLLVSDLGLPDGSGHDVMRHVRDRHRLPGIALSGYGMAEDVERSREAGFAMHLTKPVDVNRLAAAISDTAAATSDAADARGRTDH